MEERVDCFHGNEENGKRTSRKKKQEAEDGDRSKTSGSAEEQSVGKAGHVFTVVDRRWQPTCGAAISGGSGL